MPSVFLQGSTKKFNPNSASYLEFDWSGNKAERRSSNPSDVLKKLARPDMLIFAGGATCMVGQDKVGVTCSTLVTMKFRTVHVHHVACQGAGDADAAEADVEKYVDGGLHPLHYGSVKYLPCYAAAGARVKLGYFDQAGQVCPKANARPTWAFYLITA